MQKYLDKFVGCLLVVASSSLCWAGEGPRQQVVAPPIVAAPGSQGQMLVSQRVAADSIQAPSTAQQLGDEKTDGKALVSALLGLGILATVVYRAQTA